jgi:putative oxidoreductase
MNPVKQLHHWNLAHPVLYLFLRMGLGLILLFKGISFTSNAGELASILSESGIYSWQGFLISYITFAHLFGGFFLIIGLFTRVAALLQLPVLIGAVFLLNFGMAGINNGSEIALSVVSLLLLLYVLAEGSGLLSLDHYVKHHLL